MLTRLTDPKKLSKLKMEEKKPFHSVEGATKLSEKDFLLELVDGQF